MTSFRLARVAGVYENSPSRFVVNSACFIVFLRQNVVCRSGAIALCIGRSIRSLIGMELCRIAASRLKL
jgi:hypothetical protein